MTLPLCVTCTYDAALSTVYNLIDKLGNKKKHSILNAPRPWLTDICVTSALFIYYVFIIYSYILSFYHHWVFAIERDNLKWGYQSSCLKKMLS